MRLTRAYADTDAAAATFAAYGGRPGATLPDANGNAQAALPSTRLVNPT
jgi:hypothetical protein